MNKDGALVGRGFAFGRTEGDLVATGGSGRSGLGHDFEEDVMSQTRTTRSFSATLMASLLL